VLSHGYPFSQLPLNSLPHLESLTRKAYSLGRKWLSPCPNPLTSQIFAANPSTYIEAVKFLPGKNWLLVVSKGIWSGITAWDLDAGITRMAEWTPKGAIFNGFAVNADPDSKATLAVSIQDRLVICLGFVYSSAQIWLSFPRIQILSLLCNASSTTVAFQSISTIHTRMRPIALQGDIIAFSDDFSDTIVRNLKDDTCAALRNTAVTGETAWKVILFLYFFTCGPRSRLNNFKADRCIQVVFAYRCIVVIRARSIHLFAEPILNHSMPIYGALTRHSFGWLDGVSVSMTPRPNPVDIHDHPSHNPICILLRSESDDPWSQEQHTLRFFTLRPNPQYPISLRQNDDSGTNISPYLFPPSLTAEVSSVHGSLRCADIQLQPYGTAVWVHPRNRAVAGLISDDAHVATPDTPTASERLVAAVFPGRLNRTGTGDGPKTLWTNEHNDWTCLDYNEEFGRIALGSRGGSVTVLQL
jgi:hypothetical protein